MSIPTALTSFTAHTTPRLGNRHHVVVIGSGFGGLAAAKRLARADTVVTVVANTTHHLFQPLLYQVASGVLSEGEVAPPTREILRRQRNVRVLLGHVVGIDLDRRTVTSQVWGRTTLLQYDSLIVAAGARPSYFGNDQFAPFAPSLKTVDDALELSGRTFGAFELAELGAVRGEDVRHLLTFTVIGAGPTGVEMAGQIAELAQRTLRHDFRAIEPCGVRVLLLDAGPQVLPSFGPALGARAQRALERLGVEVILNAMVTNIDEQGLTVTLENGRSLHVRAATKIWAAGVSASPLGRTLAAQTGARLDHVGRLAVLPDLTLPGHPEVFVVGDMAAIDGLPGVAQVAAQGGRYAANTIARRLRACPTSAPFRYHDKGSMAIISRFRAVTKIGRLELTGALAWIMWLAVHLAYLTGFRNRFTAVLHWAVSFLGSGRCERTATEQQVFGRSALTLLPGGAADFAGRVDPTPAERLDPASGRQQ